MIDLAPQTVLRGQLNDSVNAVLFGGNNHLVTGTRSGVVNIWNLDRKRIASTKQPHQSSILSLSSIKAHNQFTSFSRDGKLKLWEFESYDTSGEAVATLNTGTMHFCNSSSDKSESGKDPNMVSTPSEREADILLWDLRIASKPCQIYSLPQSCGLTSHLYLFYGSQDSGLEGFHINSSVLYVGSEDGSLTIFDLRSSRLLLTRQLHQQPIFAIGVLNSSQTVITGAADTKLNFSKCSLAVDSQKKSVDGAGWQSVIETEIPLPTSSSVESTLETISSVSAEPSVVSLNTIHSVDLPFSRTGSICVRSDKRIVATGHWDGTVRLFECKRKFKPLAILRHHRESVYSVDFDTYHTSKYYGMFASGSKDGTVALWDLYKETI